MPEDSSHKTMRSSIQWRWGVVAACAVTLLTLIPQLHLCYVRGRMWNGSFAYFYGDERAYAAYTNALIDGRPRRNDPYSGHDEGDRTRTESLFSIQFAPAYLIAWPSRLLGLSATTAFILLTPLIAFASSLVIFRLLLMLTDDERLAACGVVFVLCLGIFVSGEGMLRAMFGVPPSYAYLPFVRRYVPGVPFVFYFVYCACVWRALTVDERRARLLNALGAGACFAFLVYSYFYHWTAAAAWLSVFAVLLLAARPRDWRNLAEPLFVIGAIAVASLIPYAILLARRPPSMDAAQALIYTHAPDLLRPITLLSFALLIALYFGARRGKFDWRDHRVLFTASLAFLPLLVFNQQVITGRSLQPMHYEQYLVNYTTLLATVLTAFLIRRVREPQMNRHHSSKRMMVLVSLAALIWGFGETCVATGAFASLNTARDEARPVALRLAELARERGGGEAAASSQIVFTDDDGRMDSLPMDAPQAVLWAPHMFVFPGATDEERKQRFYQFLYYSDVDAEEFRETFRQRGFAYYIFGWERANPVLTSDFQPVTDTEIQMEQSNYARFIATFTRERATHPTLSYVIESVERPLDFEHLDRWYERDQGERLGKYILYRVKLRQR